GVFQHAPEYRFVLCNQHFHHSRSLPKAIHAGFRGSISMFVGGRAPPSALQRSVLTGAAGSGMASAPTSARRLLAAERRTGGVLLNTGGGYARIGPYE